MHFHVLIGNDLTIAAPNVGHMMPVPAVEAPVNIAWALWANGSKHKLANDVMHMHQPIAQGFHDCGRLIPHLSPLDLVLGPAQSSRKVMLSAMDVKVQGEPVGLAEFPMLTCGIVPMPCGLAPGALANEVLVGFDPLWDLLVCAIGVYLEVSVVSTINIAIFIASLAGGPGGRIAAEVVKALAGLAIAFFAGEVLSEVDVARRVVEYLRSLRGKGRGIEAPPLDDPSAWDEI